MTAVCITCRIPLNPSGSCPRCGQQAREGASGLPGTGPRWLHSAWGRIFIGLLLAQGLFYGLRQLLTGVLLAGTGGDAAELWDNERNLTMLLVAELLAVFLGGLLAGGGQSNGLFLGCIVGVWNGVLSSVAQQSAAQDMLPFAIYLQPALHAAVGGVGGLLGSRIWRPVPAAPSLMQPQGRKTPKKPKGSPFAGKIAWIRVLLTSAIAVVGTLYASTLFYKMVILSGGKLDTATRFQDQLIIWEIRAIFVLLAGTLAGATTPNGLKQGLAVGIASASILLGIQAQQSDSPLQVAALTVISSVTLSMVGGWFGGQLFPPIVVERRRGIADA